MLGHGIAADALDEHWHISKDSALFSMKPFCRPVVEKFWSEYLPEPTEANMKRVRKVNAVKGFYESEYEKK